jgi:phage terminase large subunit GpA-like protein
VLFLTCGVDVQKDRLMYEVVGWGEGKESWSVDAGVIMFDTSVEAEWSKVDDLLARTFHTATGETLAIHSLAVDSGYNTNVVYNWARRHSMSRVLAIKGVNTAKVLVGTPSPVDVTVRGKKMVRGYKVWPVGVDVGKSELYGWLKLKQPEPGEPFPGGWCHFPEHGPDFFKQLTAEQLVAVRNERTNFVKMEWQLLPGRENHWLDCRVYARAAAYVAGLDRMRPKQPAPQPPQAATVVGTAPEPPKPPADSAPAQQRSGGWLPDSRFRGRGKGWLR